MLGVGRTGRDVSRSLGHRPNYLHERLSAQKIFTKEFLEKVLGELGYTLSDFFACMEGRLGDPRIHLARIQATAEGRPVWPSMFPPVKRRTQPKRPPVDVWELSTTRFEISLRRTMRYAGWYAFFGETGAERCEGWGVLGIAQQETAAFRHAAYCYLQALKLCEMHSEQHALLLRRLANLLGEFGEFRLYKECLSRALGMFSTYGNMESVGQIFVNLSVAYRQLGQPQNGVGAARQALKFTTDKRHLFAAHQNAGICCLELGDIPEALRMAECCRRVCESDREVFYTEYLCARCFVELKEWERAMDALQRTTNVASYDGIFLGDQLELELVNVRCHLETHSWRGAELGIERFRRVALLVSRKFANVYTSELEKLIRRRDGKAILRLQDHLIAQFRQVRPAG